MASHEKRARLYSYNGERVRFSELPGSVKHEWRSKWARKGARTLARARRKASREYARIERQRLRIRRAEARVIERVAIEARKAARARAKVIRDAERAAKRKAIEARKVARARAKAIRDVEQAAKRKAIEARKVARARAKAIRDVERAAKRKAIEARKVARAKIRAEKEAAKSKRRRSLAAKKGWKERKKRELERSMVEHPKPLVEPARPSAKNQSELMRKSFERAKERVGVFYPPLHSHFLIREMASGAVWGRLAITEFPPEFDHYTFLIDLENWVFVPSNQWLWITFEGHFYVEEKEPGEDSGEENPYRRVHGMDSLPIYPQKPGIGEPYMWTTARDILTKLKNNGQEPPEIINVNLYWDSLNEQPKMRSPLLKSTYGRPGKRRKKG